MQKELYRYDVIYYNVERNELIKIEIEKDKKVKGYNFHDGSGYMYLLSSDDDDEIMYEYTVSGECYCCMECEYPNDEQCQNQNQNQEGERYYCSKENVCVECKSDDECTNNEKGEMCHNGRCVKDVQCRNNDDCNSEELCNFNGECKKGCRNDKGCVSLDKDVKKNIICEEGECIIGCRNKENCQKGEICRNGLCSIGCNDNFDCDDYNHVCIDNQCISTSDSKLCNDDGECENGFYCDYEYFICLRGDTLSENNVRKNSENIIQVGACYFAFLLVPVYLSRMIIKKHKANKNKVTYPFTIYHTPNGDNTMDLPAPFNTLLPICENECSKYLYYKIENIEMDENVNFRVYTHEKMKKTFSNHQVILKLG